MHVAAQLRASGETGEAADGDRARVAGQDCVLFRVLAEHSENALLGVEVLDHRLDYQVGRTRGGREVVPGGDAGKRLRGSLLGRPSLLHRPIQQPLVLSAGAVELAFGGIHQRDLVATAHGGLQCDLRSHGSGADHQHALQLTHVAHPRSLA
jgi:hypothetical protein